MSEEAADVPAPQLTAAEIDRKEEEKLKAKYGPLGSTGRPIAGHTAFLQKRLAKGQKFFDSGDYQMAKQKVGNVAKQPLKVTGPVYATGEAIPTPDTIPARKTSIIQQTKFPPTSSC